MVGRAVFNHINQNGLNTSYSASTTGGQISGRVVTPPKNLSIFGLMVTRSDWVIYDALSSVGGFTNSSVANAGDGALYSGNAAMALMFGGQEGVAPYAPSAVGVAFTYSDGTTELIRPATGGEATNRDTWFIGASFKDAYEYTLFAKNLTTGMLFSQVTATTKSLKQVAQPFQILSSLPFLTTTWARQQRQLSAYVGYTGSALDADAFARIASDPWQIFRAKPRVLYFDVTAPSAAPVEVTASAVLQKTQSKTVTANAILTSVKVKSTGASAILQKTQQSTAQASASLKATLAIGTSASAVLVQEGVALLTTSANALLQLLIGRQTAASALLQKRQTVSATASGALQKTFGKTVSASAHLTGIAVISCSASASLFKNVLTAASASAIISRTGWADSDAVSSSGWAEDSASTGTGWVDDASVSGSWA